MQSMSSMSAGARITKWGPTDRAARTGTESVTVYAGNLDEMPPKPGLGAVYRRLGPSVRLSSLPRVCVRSDIALKSGMFVCIRPMAVTWSPGVSVFWPAMQPELHVFAASLEETRQHADGRHLMDTCRGVTSRSSTCLTVARCVAEQLIMPRPSHQQASEPCVRGVQ
jgi:hypothetical protein